MNRLMEYVTRRVKAWVHKGAAGDVLAQMRRLEGDNTSHLIVLDFALSQAGCTYADIGTSAQEVAELRRKGFLAEAKFNFVYAKLLVTRRIDPNQEMRWLIRLREIEQPLDARDYLARVSSNLQKAGAKLDDIGVDFDEIVDLNTRDALLNTLATALNTKAAA